MHKFLLSELSGDAHYDSILCNRYLLNLLVWTADFGFAFWRPNKTPGADYGTVFISGVKQAELKDHPKKAPVPTYSYSNNSSTAQYRTIQRKTFYDDSYYWWYHETIRIQVKNEKREW